MFTGTLRRGRLSSMQEQDWVPWSCLRGQERHVKSKGPSQSSLGPHNQEWRNK